MAVGPGMLEGAAEPTNGAELAKGGVAGGRRATVNNDLAKSGPSCPNPNKRLGAACNRLEMAFLTIL